MPRDSGRLRGPELVPSSAAHDRGYSASIKATRSLIEPRWQRQRMGEPEWAVRKLGPLPFRITWASASAPASEEQRSPCGLPV